MFGWLRGIGFEIVNIGGGFPVSYMMQSEWDEILELHSRRIFGCQDGRPEQDLSLGKRAWWICCRT